MLGAFGEHFDVNLEFGDVILGTCWDQFGIIWGPLKSFWDHFGIVLESIWNHIRVILESCLGHCGTIMESF